MSKGMRTEDEVRDSAKLVLGFDRKESGVQQGTGQITTFNQLGFRGCNDKPDGWYLPDDASKPAIILETKSEAEGVSKEKHVKELFKNIDVVAKKYSKTIGILYSGSAIRVFKNKIELSDASKRLENKDYYIRLCTSQKLDSNYIFEITQKINNSLHFKFGMTDLQDRMIFTACALVAQRYNPQNGLQKLKDMDYSTFHNWIYSALSKALEDDKKQNSKLDVLLEEYASVRMSITENQEAINDFIDNVCQIADLVNSDNWNTHRKVIWNCPFCGNEYTASINHRTSGGTECPICAKASKGERKVKAVLDELGVTYKQQESFEDLKDKQPLRFDFTIYQDDKLIAVIEFDGIQHYKPISVFGGEKAFQMQKKHDLMKVKYCVDHGLFLLQIPYKTCECDTEEYVRRLFKNLDTYQKIMENQARWQRSGR